MLTLRQREDEAAWAAWVAATTKAQRLSHLALMRAIIDAVDACRAIHGLRDQDRDERTPSEGLG